MNNRSHQAGYQRPQVGKPVRMSAKHHDGNRKAFHILLKGQISVDGDKDVELL
jgi:hypothetical protein